MLNARLRHDTCAPAGDPESRVAAGGRNAHCLALRSGVGLSPSPFCPRRSLQRRQTTDNISSGKPVRDPLRVCRLGEYYQNAVRPTSTRGETMLGIKTVGNATLIA